jgi:hypothetical protein
MQDFNSYEESEKDISKAPPIERPSTGAKIFRNSNSVFCSLCMRAVDLLTVAEAADLFRTDVQDIQYLAKQALVHPFSNRIGVLMICRDSLFACFENRRTRLLDSHFEIEIRAAAGGGR